MALLDKLEIVDEVEPEIDPDPQPDETPAQRRRKPASKTSNRRGTVAKTPRSVSAMSKQVGNDIASMLEMTAVVWGVRDQCCAPTLEAQAKPIGDALASILARNPDLLAKFANAETGLFVMQCLALGQAVLPVAKAVFTNHVLSRDEVEAEREDAVSLETFPVFNTVHPRAHTS